MRTRSHLPAVQAGMPVHERHARQLITAALPPLTCCCCHAYGLQFPDIGRDESDFWHPFHAIFYHKAYKDLANAGNCFGMSAAAAYAQVGA